MVWRPNSESVEFEAGIEWKFGGECERGGGRMRRICDWDGDAGFNFVAEYAMWGDRFAAQLWTGSADRCDGADLVNG